MRLLCITATLSLLAVILVLVPAPHNSVAGPTANAALENSLSPACTPPAEVASTPDETAWRLFVASTCPVNNDKYPFVTWENWIEQTQLYTPSGSVVALESGQRPSFHMSPLARLLREKKRTKNGRILLPESADEDCNTKTWSKRTICEEARLNPDAQNYVTTEKLMTLQGQAQFVTAGNTFQFPAPGVEVNADWIQLPACANPPQGVHLETVNSVCYDLGGIHLTSRLIDKWIWATFEPQNDVTNPQRCVVLGCRDKWGSNPPTTSGAATRLTQSLSDLMTQANLAPEWKNYRLDGVQIDFLDADGKPTRLGNSIIEGDNAGNPAKMKVSSCITCRDLSTLAPAGHPPTRISPSVPRPRFPTATPRETSSGPYP